MRVHNSAFLDRLTQSAVNFCYCWQISRKDGEILGFTNHDQDLHVDHLIFISTPGLNAPIFDHHLGMNVDSFEALGVIDSELITQNDLRAGRYHDAEVILTLRDWENPSDYVELMRGRISTIQEGSQGFQVEIRQATDLLSQKQGRQFSAMCDATLGSARCGVNLASSAFQALGHVAFQIDQLTLKIDDIAAYTSGWFSFGTLIFEESAYQNQSFSIRAHWLENSQAYIGLWVPLPWPVERGTRLTLQAGCNKSFHMCKNKFNNHINYQGFPLIPGVSYATS